METETEQQLPRVDKVRKWRFEQLSLMGFTIAQQRVLVRLIEEGELELQTVRDYIDKRHWSSMQVFLNFA